MANLEAIELKPFIPARDFDLSKRFYSDLGFTLAWSDSDLACFRVPEAAFLLQNFYVAELAGNLMIHLLVKDAASWRDHAQAAVAAKYGIEVSPLELRPWGIRDFFFPDPSGVLWRIGENVSHA